MTSRIARSADGPAATAARWIAFGLVVWLLLLTWALGIGRYGGPDEPAHITRAAAVADGQVRGAPATGMAGGFRVVRVPAALASGDPSCYRHDPGIPATCSVATGGRGTASVATSAGINPPLFYALVGLPVRWLGQADDTTWYRVVATAWNALVLTLAAWRIARGRRARESATARLVVVVALVTPATWFLLGVVNPNGLEIALALLAWASVPACLDRAAPPTASACLWVSVPAGLAIAVRPIGVVVAVAMLCVIGVSTRWWRGWTWGGRLRLGIPVAVAGIGVLAWNAWVQLAFDDPRTAADGTRWDALRESLGGIPMTAREMVGSASWLEYTMPVASQLVWWLTAAGVVVATLRARTVPGGRQALLAWTGVLLLGPVVFEVAVADRVGLIWQGRYSIAMLMGLVTFALGPADRMRRSLLWRLAVLTSLGELAAYWLTVRRFTVGDRGSWWFDAAPSGRWDPPVEPLALVATHTLVLAAALTAGYLMYPKRSMTTSVLPW